MSDARDSTPVGQIFFDAQCRFCVAIRLRWGPILERRGFVWIPLQTPGTAERLGITQTQLQTEMWLQLTDGRKFSGLNACTVLLRRVWWFWPVGALLAMPGFNALARVIYRWIATHRYSLGGCCAMKPANHKTTRRHRHSAFLEFP